MLAVARMFGFAVLRKVAFVAIAAIVVMLAEIEAPKESVQRPGLDRDALTTVCSDPVGVRPDCER